MSGGAFEYLCYKEASALVDDSDQLESMIEALEDYPGSESAIEKSKEILAKIEELRTALLTITHNEDGIRDVWKAVEWHRSNDTSAETVQQALTKFKEKA